MKAEHKQGHTNDRHAELRRILEERRREIVSEVHEKIRDVRIEGAGGQEQGVLDAAESSEADIQEEIELALIQMKSETLNRIDEALARLEQGTYGNCFECGEEIRSGACGRCPSRSGARTARRRGKSPSSVSA